MEIAKVRYEHYANKRKAKLIALNNQIHNMDSAHGKLKTAKHK